MAQAGPSRRRTISALAAATAALLSLALGAAPASATSAPSGGVVLDGFGGLHPFGGVSLDSRGSPYWQGWDIARSVSVLPDGSGGWTLDGLGGIHAWGAAPPLTGAPYWGWDIARALAVLPGGTGAYVLDGWGGVHALGGVPALSTSYYHPGLDAARGLAIHDSGGGTPDGGWVLLVDGTVHAFGAAPAVTVTSTGPVWQQLHADANGMYEVARWGGLRTLTGAEAPDWSGYGDWGGWDVLRDIVIVGAAGTGSPAPPSSAAAQSALTANEAFHGGVVLDGFGGVHPFGGLVLTDVDGLAYWPGWDIARALAILPDGSGGWTLDGFGTIHSWGAAPPLSSGVAWSGWDIARALVVLPDHQSGYVLDGFGGIHAFGPRAPALSGPYWNGWDIARGLDVHLSSSGTVDGAAVLDGEGGIHTIGTYPDATSDAYAAGHDVYRQLHDAGGMTYTVGRWGIASLLDTGLQVAWGGYTDWGASDLTRDIDVVGPGPAGGPQPSSPWAVAEYEAASGRPYDVGYRPECGIPVGERFAAGQVLAVSIACQAMTAYQGGAVFLSTLVTTGRPAYATPRGTSTILWKRSPWGVYRNYPSTYPVTEVTFAMAFDNHGDLFHDASWEPASEYGQVSTLTTNDASHGCIHVQRPALDDLYSWTKVGATVVIA